MSSTRYNNNDILKTPSGAPYYRGKFYPNVPLSENDIYIITTIGDRLDALAYTYYKDPELWWIISVANNNATKGSLFPQPGLQLRIPANVSAILNQVEKLNKSK
jgi:hypothetical protein